MSLGLLISSLSRPSCRKGFTLVELLVAVGIVALLVGLGGSIWGKALEKAALAQDVAAGKTLGAAYRAYSVENDGLLMPGYIKGASPVVLPDGSQISGEAANRYVWRLSPYFDFSINSVMYGKSRALAEKESAESGEKGYGQSISSAYGINAHYVGGVYENAQTSIPVSDVATAMVQVSQPSNLIVFATAYSSEGPGHYMVKAPRYVPRAAGTAPLEQSDWPASNGPEGSGNVDFRHDGRALCVFLDGSIRSYDVAELKDMRLWSKNAAMDDNANYAPTLEGGSSGRPGGRR